MTKVLAVIGKRNLFSIFLVLFVLNSINHSKAQTVSITASGATTFCDGNNVTLSAISQTAATAQNPGGGSATGDCNCPPGYVVVGIQGRTGSWVDQYSLVCQQLNSSGTLTGATVVTTANGTSTGGSPAGPYMLPAGKVMVGGTVDWQTECTSTFFGFCTNTENYLLSIGLKGQSPAYILASSNNATAPSTATNLMGSETSDGSSTTYVPNGSVVTGMRSFNLDTYSAGVQWIYTPIAQVMTDYLWSPGGQTTKSITVTTSGTYTLTATSGSSTGSASQVVTVNTAPAQPSSFTAGAAYGCKNTSFTYTVPPVAGATSYVWSYSGPYGATFTNGTTNSVSAKFANTNNANSGTISVAAINGCGTGPALTMNVIVSTAAPSTTSNSLTGPSPVCQGTSANYTVGSTSGATYYVWTYSGSNVTYNGDQATTSADFASNATTGNVTVKAANGCGVNGTARTKAVTVNAAPAQPSAFTTSTTSLCQSTSGVAYVVPAATNATSYSWSYSGTGTTINSGTNRSITIDYASNATSGTLSVAGVNANCGTGPSITLPITVNALPNISQIPTTGLLANYRFNGNANDETTINPGILQNTPTAVADRFGTTGSAYSFNGLSQYISTSQAYTNPNNFTISIWFKTTSTTGGKLMGMGSSQTGLSVNYDRFLYMNDAGQVYFGVYPGSIKTINSTMAYNDGNWHMATASLSSTNGMKLYIDGTLISSDATTTSGYTYGGPGGYWKIGYDNLAGWTSSPSSLWWTGSLDDVLIYNTELTAAQVNTLYTSPDGAGNNGPVCVGSTVTLSAATLASALYSWTGPSFSSSSQNPTITYLPASAGTYTLTVTLAGCSAKAYTNLTSNTATAGLWTGYSNTSWQTTNNWCGGVLPASTTNVTIPAVANLPTNNGTIDVKNLTLDPSASLTNTAAGIINVYGNWTNNGTFIDNGIYSSTGKVNFRGTTSQSISGTNTFNNLTINNSNGVSLNSAATVNGILTLTNGTFATNNNLSQNLYTGGIAGTGSGTTTGNIKFSKTIWGDKYHYLSTPISGLTVADWNDNVLVKFGANSNLYTYNETVADTNKKAGWTAVASTATSLQSAKGYALYFPRWTYNTMVDVTGSYDHSATFNSGVLTNTKSTIPVAKPASDGWHLLGNPYPSDLDWDAASGWTKTGLDNTIYAWDARTNRYTYYVGGGLGVNGGTQYIGSMQGFFVKVSTSGGTGSLAINNAARVTSTLHDVWRTTSDEKILRLKIANDINEDETVVRFKSEATEEFDSNLDAYKFLNDGSVPSLFSSSAESEYAINTLPINLASKIIPLQLNVMTTGEHTWNAALSGFEGDQLFLEDRQLDTIYDLSKNPTFKMTLTAGEQKGRFFLSYSKEENLENENENGASSSSVAGIEISALQQNVFILFGDRNSGTADIAVFDAIGEKIYLLENAPINGGKINFSLPNTSNGIYIVKVQTSASAKTQQIYIQK